MGSLTSSSPPRSPSSHSPFWGGVSSATIAGAAAHRRGAAVPALPHAPAAPGCQCSMCSQRRGLQDGRLRLALPCRWACAAPAPRSTLGGQPKRAAFLVHSRRLPLPALIPASAAPGCECSMCSQRRGLQDGRLRLALPCAGHAPRQRQGRPGVGSPSELLSWCKATVFHSQR